MKWSLNTYQTCQDWELSKILQIAEDTGYHGVELLMDYEQNTVSSGIHPKIGGNHSKMGSMPVG